MTNPQPLVMTPADNSARRSAWLFSWPLIVGALAYLFALSRAERLLEDGDTYWHIAAGQWILEHGRVPSSDPFSHTMRGAAWTAQEWLSEVLLATIHNLGAWTGVVTVSALAFAIAIALLTRALLRWLEPVYVLLFAAFAVAMTAGHLLARPHVLAMPLMMIWSIGLVHASESGRAPTFWLLPVMTIWANAHGGFTLGLALAFAFAVESLLIARGEQRLPRSAKSWGLFLALAVAVALVTPHGPQGIFYTWEVLFESSYALQNIGEWRSPDFQYFQPLEIWLLAGLALVMHQGLRLPPIRLLLLLGLIHLALKHGRSIELLGLLTPLFLASPFSAQWRQARQQQPQQQVESVDRFFCKLAQPAGRLAILLTMGILVLWTQLISHARPPQPPKSAAPTLAIQAVRNEKIKGPVLNGYSWGGYLIYSGIPPFVDGRSDMYRDDFLKKYIEAVTLDPSGDFEKFLNQYKIEWTLLSPEIPATTLLDHLPEWRRLYADKVAVVHVRIRPSNSLKSEEERSTLPSSSSPVLGEKR